MAEASAPGSDGPGATAFQTEAAMARNPGTGEKLMGKAKRLIGELTGRPDLVLDGEAQDTGLPREDEQARQSAGPTGETPRR